MENIYRKYYGPFEIVVREFPQHAQFTILRRDTCEFVLSDRRCADKTWAFRVAEGFAQSLIDMRSNCAAPIAREG